MGSLKAIDLIEKDFLRVEREEALSKLFGKMISSKKDSALVFAGNDLAGIVSRHAIARKKIFNPAKIKISAVMDTVPVLEPNTLIEKIAELMFSSNARILPVAKDAEIIGIVSDLAVAKSISELPEIKRILVKEIFSKAIVLQKDATIAQALSIMREKQPQGIPIIGFGSALAGFVSLTDIFEKFFLFPKEKKRSMRFSGGIPSSGFSPEKASLANLPISNEMAENVVTISPEETVLKAAMLMASKSIHALVVLQDSAVVGLLSPKEILGCIKKIGAERSIQIAGMPEVDEVDKAKVVYSINASYDKLSRIIQGSLLLHVHFKEHHKEGMRKKHVVRLKLSHAGKPIVSEAFDWNLLSALQQAIKALERETINSAKRK